MKRKKLTVYDYLGSKGKRQLSALFVHSADEAKAAEEAGIDIICTSHDYPDFGIYNSFEELKRIRAGSNLFNANWRSNYTCFRIRGIKSMS